MKHHFLLLFTGLLVFIFATSFSKGDIVFVPLSTTENKSDTFSTRWIDDFKTFREAVYQNDTAKLKSFFKFPVLNPSNEIWYLVLGEKELEEKNFADKVVPFTEKDFEKYYKKLFPASFIKSVLKIKSEQLFTKDRAETPEIRDSTSTTVKMYATFDKVKNILSLNLIYKTPWKEDAEGTVLEGGESGILYSFRILKNQHLQFMYVRIAG